MPTAIPVSPPTVTDWPFYWFAKLEKAIAEGDHQVAAESQRELDRLGVQVRYGHPRASGGRPGE